jgi:hypothetical protein
MRNGTTGTITTAPSAPYRPLLRGTLLPARRASDKPIAIACRRLLTRRPERPLRSLPRFISCSDRRTLLPLARLYLRAMVLSCWSGGLPAPAQ